MVTAAELLSDPALGLVREVRPSQVRMAESVEEVLHEGGVYFAEGPVGCGKSFAYLTPALLAAGRRVVIATAKKQLQDQVFAKDLSAIASVVGPETLARVLQNAEGDKLLLATVLKGKGNYACRLQAEKHAPDAGYQYFLAQSRYGDRADYRGAPPPWFGTATAEDCIGRGCKYASSCGYIRLKGDLAQSRMAVVNHHVLGADMYYGHGKMMGGAFTVLIVDEAHKLAEGIRSAFTVKVSEHAIENLIKALTDTPWPFVRPKQLMGLWERMFAALPHRSWREAHLREIPVFPEHAGEVVLGLSEIEVELATLLERYGVKGGPADPAVWEAIGQADVDDDTRRKLAVVAQSRRKVSEMERGIHTMQGRVKPLEGEDPEDHEMRKERILENSVAYGSSDGRGRFHLHCAPVNLGGIAKSYFAGIRSVILTSATLAVGDRFGHLSDVIGVEPTKAEVLPSTFDYGAQGFLYVPKDLPHRTREAPDYLEVMNRRVARCVRLCELSQGGAFVLTTANDELDAFATALKARFPGCVFAQGHARAPWDGDPAAVLDRYLRTPNAILVGSKSFWEGVDVVGERLRLVVIAKLPFPIFTDPIVRARERAAGEGAFARVQLVDMLTDLRQGAGRLIRSRTDRGVVAILDSRVWERSYGRQVRATLQFPVTPQLAECEQYLPRVVTYFQRLTQRGSNGQPSQSV